MKKYSKYQNLFNHPHILYKYFPINKEFARRSKEDPTCLVFTPNLDRSVILDGWDTVDKWKTIAFEGAIYCTSPAFFNDPYDTALPSMPEKVPTDKERKQIISQLSENFHFTFKEIKELLDEDDFEKAISNKLQERKMPNYLCQEFINEMKENTQLYKELMAIACFSETNKSKLMWAHYANSYTGFCLEYDFTRIMDIKFRKGICKVVYSNEKPIREDYNNYYDYTSAVLATKSEDWSYEKEWRLINVLPYDLAIHKNYPVYCAKDAITAIYMGCNIDKEKRREIIEYFTKVRLPAFEMSLHDDEYGISFVRCN